MNRAETDKILFIIRAAYPEVYARLGKTDIELLSITWSKLLEEYTFAQVSAGLELYMRTDTFGRAPKVGQIIDAIAKAEDKAMNANEAWAQVYKAICNGSYGAEEEFAKLDKTVQKAVGSPANLREFAAMDIKDVSVTIKAHFKSVYEAELKRQAEEKKMPQRLREALGGNDTIKIEGGSQ